jgi:hypothetical protein
VFELLPRRVRRIFPRHPGMDRDSPFRERSLGRQNRDQRLRLVAFCGESGFRIGTGNFAHRNPAEAADKGADRATCASNLHSLSADVLKAEREIIL